MVSAFRGAIDFFGQLGVYDVVLPFLLVFTIVFAILEKTKVLGGEGKEEKEPRKNLNAVVAFVMALFVVASSRIVGIINQGLAQVALIMVMLIGFLLLLGTLLSGQGEDPTKHLKKWETFGVAILGLSVLTIFLNQVGWLEPAWKYVTGYWDSTAVSSIILLVVMVGFIYFIAKTDEEKKPDTGAKP